MPSEEDCHSQQWQTDKKNTVLRADSGEQDKKNAIAELVTCARTSLDSQVRQLEYLSTRVREKLDLLNSMQSKGSYEQIKILFQEWDTNRDGYVDFQELALGLSRLGPQQLVGAAADSAVKCLTEFDKDRNQKLSLEEMEAFVRHVAQQSQSEVSDVTQLLILTALQSQPQDKVNQTILSVVRDEAVKRVRKAQDYTSALKDPRMSQLFHALDRNNDGQISFAELALAIKKLDPNASLAEARSLGVDCLLLVDADSKRYLGEPEFAKFIQRLCMLSGKKFTELADKLLSLAKTSLTSSADDDTIMTELRDNTPGSTDAALTLAERKVHHLFDLWDKDGDGKINLVELALGLRKFQPGSSINEAASRAAEAMLDHDSNASRTLSRADFARFIEKFAKKAHTDFHSVADFMIMLAVTEDDPSEEIALLMAEDRIIRLIAGAQGKLDRFQHVDEDQVSGRKRHQEEPCQTKISSNVVTNPDNTKSLVST
ncbi:hypothetical protein WJX74_003904 [Apatococcus lobatus]|uniref:EF-hand domain-containing protein n=2 Tax=Apatococcus TaxID=904362 RepID=A0AAW1SRG2_9CHLO